MLKALYDYAVQKGLTLPPGYVNKTIRAYILLSADGKFLGIEQREAEMLPCPDIGSLANGRDKCNILAEKKSVILSDGKDAKNQFFRAALREGAFAEPALTVCLTALEDESVFSMILAEAAKQKIKPGDRISFCVDNVPIVKSAAVQTWWQDYRQQFIKSGSERKTRCLITGERTLPMSTVPPVNGLAVVGGHARGDALICFDKNAFCSYGLEHSANAPVSEEAFSAVKAALDDLLGHRDSAPILAGMKFVHWYEKPVPPEQDCLLSLTLGAGDGDEDEEDAEEEEDPVIQRQAEAGADRAASELIRAPLTGQPAAPLRNRYHILILTGANGRVMIRRYEEGSYEELQKNVSRWDADLELTNMAGTGSMKPAKLIARLLRLLSRQKTDQNPFDRARKELSGLTPAILMSILTGAPLPDAVAARALAYIRSHMLDAGDELKTPPIPDGISCQWLKVWLMRKNRSENKEDALMPNYNPEHPSAAYHCGAIMAVYADVQKEAMPDVNAGVIQRYYAAASQTPALVIGRLNTLSNYHFEKIEWKWMADMLNEQLNIAYCALGGTVPVTLNLEQQAYFALGYRQMAADLNRMKNEKYAEIKEKKVAKADDKAVKGRK